MAFGLQKQATCLLSVERLRNRAGISVITEKFKEDLRLRSIALVRINQGLLSSHLENEDINHPMVTVINSTKTCAECVHLWSVHLREWGRFLLNHYIIWTQQDNLILVLWLFSTLHKTAPFFYSLELRKNYFATIKVVLSFGHNRKQFWKLKFLML